MRDVAGKVAFITGAASGMGLGMAKAFTRVGMKVMMADIDEKRLQAAAAELKAKGADVDTHHCDITVEKQVFDAAAATVKRFGKVNVLCNNAGVSVGGLSEELSQKDWDWVIAVNQTAVVYALRAFLPLMKTNGESGHVMATSGARLELTALADRYYAEVQAMGGSRWDTSSLAARLQARS